jgi:hypothetical protein
VAGKRTAWFCVRESLHDFRLYEWAPFGWILIAQVLFLLAALNLGSVWGMAIVGGVAGLVGRSEQIIHYPTVFILLPSLSSLVEWVLYVVAGSVLIPIALLRIAGPMEGGPQTEWRQRVGRAILPTLLAGLMNIGLLQLWDWVLTHAVAPVIQPRLPEILGLVVPWFIGALGAYLIAAPFIYVPIHAIHRGSGLGGSLVRGIGEGLRSLWPTFVIIVVCSWPALFALAAAQVNPAVVVRKMRPELVAYLLLAYAILTSLASYLIYASASRLHWARRAE